MWCGILPQRGHRLSIFVSATTIEGDSPEVWLGVYAVGPINIAANPQKLPCGRSGWIGGMNKEIGF